MNILGLNLTTRKNFQSEAIKEAYGIIENNRISSKIDFFSWIGDKFHKGFCIDLNSASGLKKAYLKCSPVPTVINRNSTALGNGKWWIVDDTDTDVLDRYPEIKELIKRPNPFQSWQEFTMQFDIYRQIFGEAFIYAPSISGVGRKWMFVLLPCNVNPKIKENIDLLDIENGVISSYEYSASRFKSKNIDPKDIIHIKDIFQGLSEDGIQFRGKSRLTSLEYEVKNVIQAQEAIYSLNKDRGAQGILTNDAKDADGVTILNPAEKKNVEERLREKYGLGTKQAKIIVTEMSLKWQQMSFNVKDLMLFEGIKQNIESISDSFNYPFELLANSKGTTYANKNEAKKSLYQDGIIPIAEIYSQAFTRFFQLKDGHKFIIDFSHVEALQEAEKEKAEAKRALNMANQIAFQNRVISLEEWREDLGLDQKITGGTMYETTETN